MGNIQLFSSLNLIDFVVQDADTARSRKEILLWY